MGFGVLKTVRSLTGRGLSPLTGGDHPARRAVSPVK